MTGPTTLSASWLMLPGVSARTRRRMVLLAAGVTWDAVRTPLGYQPVFERLMANGHDRALLGPVLADTARGCLYWFIAPGATNDWPDEVLLLGAGSWLVAPRSVYDITPDARWLHLPDHPIVSGPAWLAAALDTARRAA